MAIDTTWRLTGGTGQNVTSVGGSSTASTAFGTATTQIRVVATAAVNIRIDSGTPTAVTTDTLIAANFPEYFTVAGNQKLASIGAATVNITEVS